MVDDPALADLQRLTQAHTEVLRVLAEHVHALGLVTAAAMGTLDGAGRASVRSAALRHLGHGQDQGPVADLIRSFTSVAPTASAAGLGRLQ